MKTQRRLAVFNLIVSALILSPAALAQTTLFNYQGNLVNSGTPATGSFDFEFLLYNSLSGGAQVGTTQVRNGVAVAAGVFKVDLDFGSQFPGTNRFLEIRVRPAGGGTHTPLTPRQLISSTPYAVKSLNAENAVNATNATNATNSTNAATATNALQLGGVAANQYLQTNGSGSGLTNVNATQLNGQPASFYQNAGNLANGTLSVARLPVPLLLTGNSSGDIIRGENASNAGRGVYGVASGLSGIGVLGVATSPAPGVTFGVFGQTASSEGRGVFGDVNITTGVNYGGLFHNRSPTGEAVRGYNFATTGGAVGGYFISASVAARALYGLAIATSGESYGVVGQSNSPGGVGVWGTGGLWGLYSQGPMFVNGNFAAGGAKNFRIDHPDDPENKYLLHYSTESPEVTNFYRGMVVLNNEGEAIVELPHYFAKINKTPSYTLTAVGAPMPMLHVAKEIDEAALTAGAKAGPSEAAPKCSFRISGGTPGMKVSWRIEAVRNDLWFQKRGALVEVEKQGAEKGTYQQPDLYGQPPEKGVNYNLTREHKEQVQKDMKP